MTRKAAALERLRLLKIPDLIRTTWQANDHFCYPFLAPTASQVRFARPAYVLPIAVHVRDVPSQDITSQPAIVPLFHEGNVRQAEFPAVRAMSVGFAWFCARVTNGRLPARATPIVMVAASFSLLIVIAFNTPCSCGWMFGPPPAPARRATAAAQAAGAVSRVFAHVPVPFAPTYSLLCRRRAESEQTVVTDRCSATPARAAFMYFRVHRKTNARFA